MSYDIKGWVETTVMEGEEQLEEYAWQSLINIGGLIGAADFISERLFGLSRRCTSGEIEVQSLAANRGFPSNPSSRVLDDLEWIHKHEARLHLGEWVNFPTQHGKRLKILV